MITAEKAFKAWKFLWPEIERIKEIRGALYGYKKTTGDEVNLPQFTPIHWPDESKRYPTEEKVKCPLCEGGIIKTGDNYWHNTNNCIWDLEEFDEWPLNYDDLITNGKQLLQAVILHAWKKVSTDFDYLFLCNGQIFACNVKPTIGDKVIYCKGPVWFYKNLDLPKNVDWWKCVWKRPTDPITTKTKGDIK